MVQWAWDHLSSMGWLEIWGFLQVQCLWEVLGDRILKA